MKSNGLHLICQESTHLLTNEELEGLKKREEGLRVKVHQERDLVLYGVEDARYVSFLFVVIWSILGGYSNSYLSHCVIRHMDTT